MSSYHNIVNHIYHSICLPIKYIKILNGVNVVNGFNKLTTIKTFIIYSLILVNCIQSLQIPDQQAIIGKSIVLYFSYYHWVLTHFLLLVLKIIADKSLNVCLFSIQSYTYLCLIVCSGNYAYDLNLTDKYLLFSLILANYKHILWTSSPNDLGGGSPSPIVMSWVPFKSESHLFLMLYFPNIYFPFLFPEPKQILS